MCKLTNVQIIQRLLPAILVTINSG